MDEVMISLQAPVAWKKIDRWVGEQLDRLRIEAWPTGVRLGPLVDASPVRGADWLVRVDLGDRAVRLEDDVALASVLTDMERLGLRPALFLVAPRERTGARAKRPSPTARRVTASCGPRARRSPPI